MEEKSLQILSEINKSLKEINVRQRVTDEFKETEHLISNVDKRVDHATYQIQNSLDRIHDKVFNFNNILIAAFLVLGTFPNNDPLIELWTVVFPILNLIFMIYLDIRQMGIHRMAANEKNWKGMEAIRYGKKINSQTLLSLLSFGLSFATLLYLIVVLN